MTRILIINPGSTSTKIGIWEEDRGLIFETNVIHTNNDLAAFQSILDQKDYRKDAIRSALLEKGFQPADFTAIAARGGLLKPLTGGTYYPNGQMLDDLKREAYGRHASNLGALLAADLSAEAQIPAYITDPVSVDEFIPLARYSGWPEIRRRSLLHALNIKAVSQKLAAEMGREMKDLNFIVVHLGGGISIAALYKGRVIDVNNANEMGPFSPERAGTLPVGDLVEMAFSGKYSRRELKDKITRSGGLFAYLGSNDCREIERRIEAGDEEAKIIYDAMIYQISKGVGAKAAVLKGKVEAIILTGGLAGSSYVVEAISRRIEFLAPVKVYPGTCEMEALALGAYRVLMGWEEAKTYQ